MERVGVGGSEYVSYVLAARGTPRTKKYTPHRMYTYVCGDIAQRLGLPMHTEPADKILRHSPWRIKREGSCKRPGTMDPVGAFDIELYQAVGSCGRESHRAYPANGAHLFQFNIQARTRSSRRGLDLLEARMLYETEHPRVMHSNTGS